MSDSETSTPDDIAGEAKLNFPDGTDFVSRRGDVPLDVIFKLSESRLPLVNADPKSAERRLRTKSREFFTL